MERGREAEKGGIGGGGAAAAAAVEAGAGAGAGAGRAIPLTNYFGRSIFIEIWQLMESFCYAFRSSFFFSCSLIR